MHILDFSRMYVLLVGCNKWARVFRVLLRINHWPYKQWIKTEKQEKQSRGPGIHRENEDPNKVKRILYKQGLLLEVITKGKYKN
jgi:hypothetical protein